jgi:hypothetical protein
MNSRFVSILLLPMTSLADDPFACVDPHVTAAFLYGGYDDESSFTTSVPADFADMQLPGDLNIVGSRINKWGAIVVYRTTQTADQALSEITKELSSTGWSDATRESTRALGGFQTRSIPETTVFCRNDGPGIVNVTAWEINETTYVQFSRGQNPKAANCGSLLSSGHHGHSFELMSFMPVLELPKDVKTSQGSGGGGSSDQVYSNVIVTTEIARSALIAFFGDQIREQDWNYDASWTGSVSSGSLWIRDDSEIGLLVGTLSITGTTDGAYKVQFDLASTDP